MMAGLSCQKSWGGTDAFVVSYESLYVPQEISVYYSHYYISGMDGVHTDMEPQSPLQPNKNENENDDGSMRIPVTSSSSLNFKASSVGGGSIDGMKSESSEMSGADSSISPSADFMSDNEATSTTKVDDASKAEENAANTDATNLDVNETIAAETSTSEAVAAPDPFVASPVGSDVPEVNEQQTPAAVVAPVPDTTGVVVPPVTVGGKGKKKWLIPVVVGGLIALLAGGYVLGVYLPNRPENAYKLGLKLTGIATDRVIDYQKTRKAYPSGTLDATATVKQAGGSFDMTLKGESSETQATMTADANIAGQKINVDLRAVDVEKSENPDIYFKATGVAPFLQQISTDPKLAQLDGKWIAVDHTLFDTYQKQLESQSGAQLQKMPTKEQITDALTKAQAVNKEYIYTTNKDKAVLIYKEYVGKATRNSRQAFHYKTSYDKAHLKAYVKALGAALDSSKLNDWSKDQADGKKLSALLRVSDIQSSIDKLKDGETFDLFIDQGTKLVQSVVFKSTGSEAGTFTIAQNYTGGDKYPFELSAEQTSGGSTKAVIGMTLDTKTDKTLFNVKFDMGSGGTTLDMNGTFVPSNKKVTVEVPTGAIPFMQVMQQFGVDPNALTQETTPPSTTLTPSRT